MRLLRTVPHQKLAPAAGNAPGAVGEGGKISKKVGYSEEGLSGCPKAQFGFRLRQSDCAGLLERR